MRSDRKDHLTSRVFVIIIPHYSVSHPSLSEDQEIKVMCVFDSNMFEQDTSITVEILWIVLLSSESHESLGGIKSRIEKGRQSGRAVGGHLERGIGGECYFILSHTMNTMCPILVNIFT